MTDKISPTNLTEEQLKALYDPIRIRIAHLLKTPRTPKQVADIINIRPNNLYYHFRVLEKAGIIEHIETKDGKGFIKENFFRLKSEDIQITPEMVPLYGRMKFFQNLIKAAMEDLGEAAGKYDKVAGIGSRDDFSIPEDRLEKARNIILERKDDIIEELKELHDPDADCNYQLNVFCFRL
jgi:DNA-binding transcriptional ArsR family regulator